jgi:hypothetical protein
MAHDREKSGHEWLMALATVLSAVIAAIATITGAFLQVRAARNTAPTAQQDLRSTPLPATQEKLTSAFVELPKPPLAGQRQAKTSRKSSRKAGATPENERLASLESAIADQRQNYERSAAWLNGRLSLLEERHAKDKTFNAWLIVGILFMVGAVVPLSFRNFAHVQSRRSRAYRFIERWSSPEFVNLRKELLPLYEGRRRAQELEEPLVYTLNFFEEMAMAVLSHSADEEILKQFFSAVTLSSFRGALEFIHFSRMHMNDPTVWAEYERLTQRWAAML